MMLEFFCPRAMKCDRRESVIAKLLLAAVVYRAP